MSSVDELTIIELDADLDTGSEPVPPPSPELVPIAGLIVGLLAVVGVLLLLSPSADRSAGSDPGATTTLAPAATTSVAPASAPDASGTAEDTEVRFEAGGGPILGGPVGLEVWVGGDTSISRLDLDSGDIETFAFRGYPAFVTGRWLVYFDAIADSFFALDRDAPTEDPIVLDGGDLRVIDAAGPGPVEGSVWTAARSRPTEVHWRLVSLITGTTLRTATSQTIQGHRLPFRVAVTVGPEVDIRDDELFVLGPAGFEPWVEGRLVARDSSIALVETCVEGDCAPGWWDLETLEPLEKAVPTELLDHTEVLAGGAWLHTWAGDSSASFFIDTESQIRYDTQLRRSVRQFDISSDGAWAGITGGGLRMLDLATGDVVAVPSMTNRIGTSSSIVLAPSP